MKKIAYILAPLLALAVSSGAMAQDSKLNLVKDGELRVLTNPIYPPMEFVNPDSGELDGFDIDLGKAIAKKLNLEILWVPSAFAQLQSSLQTNRGDMILSGMSDNVKRQQSMDFVDYITSGPIFFTLTANAGKYKATADLCGQTVAGSRSVSFGSDVGHWSDENCVAKGKPAIKFEGTEDSNAARLGMKQARYEAVVQGIETIAYQMKLEPNTYAMVGEPILNNDVFGMGFKKDNTGLRDAVLKALQEVIKDGDYQTLLNKWGLVHNAIPAPVVNGVK